jgi:eukaryotic-like serine/threonine-protein kinase
MPCRSGSVLGMRLLKARQKLGKYRVVQRLADGGFACVYDAYDTIENLHVALKVPHTENLTPEQLQDLYREVRLTARLRHPNILSIKNAEHIGKVFSIAYPLGLESLLDRLGRRIGPRHAMAFAEQLLGAVAFAHEHRVIHCDIKPENVVLLDEDHVALTDFGIAKVALRTQAMSSVAGTLGYMAPEHAMGRPSYRSDVFSLGLVLWRLFSGKLPEWPFAAPLSGLDRLKRTYSSEFIAVLERALQLDQKKRFANAAAFHNAFLRVKRRALRGDARSATRANGETPSWQTLREKEFRRRFGKHLKGSGRCGRCQGLVSEAMTHCPWCGQRQQRYRGHSTYTSRCKDCGRGTKGDWKYCTWCRAPQRPKSDRAYPDKRYVATCTRCNEHSLVQFSRYCPRCRYAVTKTWSITSGHGNTSKHGNDRCRHCDWGTLRDFWNHCPWCSKPTRTTERTPQA